MSEAETPPEGLRGRVRQLVEARWFQRAITVVILINAVTLGLETSATVMDAIGPTLLAFDTLVLGIFVVELLLKLFAYRWGFWRNGWNVFDFIIVAIALMPASGSLSVLRALRILRVLRLLSVVPQMRRVIQALLQAIPGMSSIILVLGLVFYVSAVLATKLFGLVEHPADADGLMQEWFGTIPRSMYTLFQVMTLESWSMGIVRPTMDLYPWAWLFFLPFIVITSFAVLNLFIAIIVNAMQSQHEADRAEEEKGRREEAHQDMTRIGEELAALRREVAALRLATGKASEPEAPRP